MSDLLRQMLFIVVCLGFGSFCLLFPQIFQAQAIRDYSRFPWRYMRSRAKQVASPEYLIEVRMCGIAFIAIGLMVLIGSLVSHEPKGKPTPVATHQPSRS